MSFVEAQGESFRVEYVEYAKEGVNSSIRADDRTGLSVRVGNLRKAQAGNGPQCFRNLVRYVGVVGGSALMMTIF